MHRRIWLSAAIVVQDTENQWHPLNNLFDTLPATANPNPKPQFHLHKQRIVRNRKSAYRLPVISYADNDR